MTATTAETVAIEATVAAATPRVPRGFAPKTSLYGVDDTPAYNESPELGQRCRAHRSPRRVSLQIPQGHRSIGSRAPKPTEANIIIPSAPEYTIPAGWDGGATLPGESLSRHRRSEKVPIAALSTARIFAPTFATIKPASSQAASPFSSRTRPPQRRTSSSSMRPHPQLLNISTIDLQHELFTPAAPVEYEPTDASASYRVDPAAPSEFRQSAPVLESPEAEEAAESEAAKTITPEPSTRAQRRISRAKPQPARGPVSP